MAVEGSWTNVLGGMRDEDDVLTVRLCIIESNGLHCFLFLEEEY